MENPFGKKPVPPIEKPKTLAETILESLEKDPYSYRSLRKSVDEGKMTQEEAEKILSRWKEVIEKQEKAYREDPANAAEIAQIKKEKVESKYGYPETYKVKDLNEQFEYLHDVLNLSGLVEISDNLETDPQVQELKTSLQIDAENPHQLDGIFYIPPIYLVAEAARKQHPEETKDKPDEEVSTWYVLKRLKETREEIKLPSFNYYLFGLSSQNLRIHPRAALVHAKNELRSPVGGFVFLPIQSGLSRKGESPRYALANLQVVKSLDEQSFREVPLDLYSAVCLMLTHPERANYKNSQPDLFIWTAGSRVNEDDGLFDYVPNFDWGTDYLALNNDGDDDARSYYGVASAFVPE